MKALLVVELNVANTDQITEAIAALKPPRLPYFAGTIRVVMDEFFEGADNPATALLNYLDGKDEGG